MTTQEQRDAKGLEQVQAVGQEVAKARDSWWDAMVGSPAWFYLTCGRSTVMLCVREILIHLARILTRDWEGERRDSRTIRTSYEARAESFRQIRLAAAKAEKAVRPHGEWGKEEPR